MLADQCIIITVLQNKGTKAIRQLQLGGIYYGIISRNPSKAQRARSR
jgi:hypothetical protein